jgi:hypothetical protein
MQDIPLFMYQRQFVGTVSRDFLIYFFVLITKSVLFVKTLILIFL